MRNPGRLRPGEPRRWHRAPRLHLRPPAGPLSAPAPLLGLGGGRWCPAEGSPPPPPQREAAPGAGNEPPAAISRPGGAVAVRSPAGRHSRGRPSTPPAPGGRARAPSACPAGASHPPEETPASLPRPTTARSSPRGSRRLPSVKLPGRPQGEAGRQEQPQGEIHGRRGGAGWAAVAEALPTAALHGGPRGRQGSPAAADTGCAATAPAANPSLSARPPASLPGGGGAARRAAAPPVPGRGARGRASPLRGTGRPAERPPPPR